MAEKAEKLCRHVKKDGSPDEKTLRAQGGSRHIRFLRGHSSTTPGSTSAPSEDCRTDGDADDKIQLHFAGYGHVEGETLKEAVELMKARVSGSEAAPAPKSKSK